jgi:hypothetical protein
MSQQRTVREPDALPIPSSQRTSFSAESSGSDKPGTDPRSVELPTSADGATMQTNRASQPRDDLDDNGLLTQHTANT